MHKLLTYLCGPIHGKTDFECSSWRNFAKRRLITDTLDPLRNDYRGRESDKSRAIVASDFQDIRDADFILVKANEPGWGTAMEILYASQQGKWIVAYVGNLLDVSPWLRAHCSEIVSSLEIAITLINARAGA